MINRLINRFIKKVSRGSSLDRYYVFKLFGFGIFIHNIHASDPVGLFHSHPWNGVSFILGNYAEERLLPNEYGMPPRLIRHRRYGLNFIRAKTPHRVEVLRPTWTLFIHAHKSNIWGIVDRFGQVQSEAPWEGETGHKNYAEAGRSYVDQG